MKKFKLTKQIKKLRQLITNLGNDISLCGWNSFNNCPLTKASIKKGLQFKSGSAKKQVINFLRDQGFKKRILANFIYFYDSYADDYNGFERNTTRISHSLSHQMFAAEYALNNINIKNKYILA